VAEWFTSNAGWFGPLVAVIIALIGWFLQVRLRDRRHGSKVRQRQRSGRGSTNVQIGGDVRLSRQVDDER
jgi:hypothetical protein